MGELFRLLRSRRIESDEEMYEAKKDRFGTFEEGGVLFAKTTASHVVAGGVAAHHAFHTSLIRAVVCGKPSRFRIAIWLDTNKKYHGDAIRQMKKEMRKKGYFLFLKTVDDWSGHVTYLETFWTTSRWNSIKWRFQDRKGMDL